MQVKLTVVAVLTGVFFLLASCGSEGPGKNADLPQTATKGGAPDVATDAALADDGVGEQGGGARMVRINFVRVAVHPDGLLDIAGGTEYGGKIVSTATTRYTVTYSDRSFILDDEGCSGAEIRCNGEVVEGSNFALDSRGIRLLGDLTQEQLRDAFWND